ncbi:cytochrome-c peroxidase [Calidifontibacillus erzurumensis]|uniref:Methylamine utilization protein MauG n=1 Tax=Calidifontibacillus erzurumensis TaxID=2741433 RepID=A0A8J8GB78_9BACI|nr:cytochrome-c peroxidase [Calidifontibacillus erzurumensis]NSL50492.1 cytochrome-c peroxidase [Calidifontibacillus erzurumensis]
MKTLKWGGTILLSLGLIVGCSNSGKVDNANVQPPVEAETVIDHELEEIIAKFQPIGDIPVPADNPMTEEKVELGKKLYFDPRLSGNNKISCFSCHATTAGYGDNLPTFIGFEGHQGARNSPTVINAGYYTSNFWDGRAASLEEQALGPIQSEVEMNQNLDELITELKAVPGYVDEFNKVFNDEITAENIAKAIATFERTITITDTRFDRFLAGERDALTAQEIEGMKLFAGKANCMSCHAGPTLSDNNFHNIGLEGDDGRYGVTNQEADKGKFRTPGLRGVAHTAPYMHDGSLATLEDVVKYYNEGGGNHPNKDPLMVPLNLSDEEIKSIVAFLESMSGEVPVVEAPELP